MTRYIAAFDGGGSFTRCVIVDEIGAVLGEGVGGGVTQIAEDGGPEKCRRAVTEAFLSALRPNGLHMKDMSLAYLGMSGASPEMEVVIQDALRDVAEVVVVHDSETALSGCLAGEPGVVVIGGTGYWIGCQALSVATRAADGVISDTLLQEWIPRDLGCVDLEEVHEKIHAGTVDRPGIASISKTVADAAENGDQAARTLLFDAGVHLAGVAVSVMKKLKMEKSRYTYTGGVFGAHEWILTPFKQEIEKHVTNAELTKPFYDCLDGVVFLGMEYAGISAEVYKRFEGESQSKGEQLSNGVVRL